MSGKPKTILTLLLAGFVLLSLGVLTYKSLGEEPTLPVAKPAAVEKDRLVVSYFHGKQRCPTCLKMERYAKEAVAEAFAKEVAAGQVEIRVVDTSLPANAHYIKDYDLGGNALIVAEFRGGTQRRFKNLESIWDLADNEVNFKLYVADEVRAFLRGR